MRRQNLLHALGPIINTARYSRAELWTAVSHGQQDLALVCPDIRATDTDVYSPAGEKETERFWPTCGSPYTWE